MGCGGERRAVGKTGLGSLQYIPTRSDEPQDRSPGPLGARYASQNPIVPQVRYGGKGVTPFPTLPDYSQAGHVLITGSA